jgi:hypothetical protein
MNDQNNEERLLSIDDLENLMDKAEDISSEIESPKFEKPKEYTDFDEFKKTATRDAKNIIKKLIAFYLNTDMAKDKYTIKKVSIDIANLSNCMFQLQSSEYAVKKALEEIDQGIANDRMFKVLADLQKQNMEIMKYNKQYIQIIEQEYADFAANFEEYKNNSGGNLLEGEGTKITDVGEVHRGTKSLLNNLDDDGTD